MKTTKFFAAALAVSAIVFASCVKEEGKNQQQGAETYAGISIVMESRNPTRAQDTDYAGTVKESAIASVKVFIIDDNSGEMQTHSFTSTDFAADPTNSGYQKASAAILTTVGTKTVYVVANPTTALSALLNSAAAVKSNVLALAETGYYTWTGASFDGKPANLTNLVMSGKSASTAIALQDAAAALASPVKVDLSRNVAKISVKEAATVDMGTYGTLEDMAFGLAAKAKHSYLTAKTNPALYTTPATPVPAAYFTENFSPRTGLTYVDVNASGVGIDAANAWFALEHKADKWYEGNSTKIVVKGVYTPAKVVATYTAGGAVTVGTITKGTSFYVKKSTQEAWSVDAYASALSSTDMVADDFSEIYQNGVGYYQINIIDGTAARVRGIERNNIYEMTITSVSGPGDPTEDGGGGDDDENEEESYIAVTIKPIAWTYNTWNQGIQ